MAKIARLTDLTKFLFFVCEKAKKAFTKSANTKKIAKVTKIFIATIKKKMVRKFRKSNRVPLQQQQPTLFQLI